MHQPVQTIRENQQERIRRLIEAARTRGAHTFYLGGYCANSQCSIRDVLVRVKDHDPAIREVRCPSCRTILSLGSDQFGLEMKTASEFLEQRQAEARDNVALQLYAESHGDQAMPLSDLPQGTTLDDLQALYQARAPR